MTVEDVLREMGDKIRATVPSSIDITDVEFEGAMLVIYTKHPEKFADNGDIVRHLAKILQKRIVIRPDPSVLADIDSADASIRKIIPAEAGVTNIYFEPDIGEITIEAEKPGIAIGQHGNILNEIKKAVGWTPKVIRTPPIMSKTVQEIRGYIRSMADERKNILRTVGRKIHRGSSKDDQWVRLTALGGYREVGRSCSLLSTQDSKVLIDCGVNVGNDNHPSPYIHLGEVLPLQSIDAVVITHAHLDHCGLLPLLYKYGYEGPVYCTFPTRDLMTLLQIDYLKVAQAEAKKAPYSSEHIRDVIKHTIPMNYGDTVDIAPDVRLTFHNAGHILGSAVCHFHVGDGLYNILFTGDMKYERTWLFNPAHNRFPRVETVVMESTYGASQDFQPSRNDASDQIKDLVGRTLSRGGHVLIPVFAVGRSQEVMIVLEQLMRTGQIPKTPVYLDGMIWEATAIHTAYPEYLNTQLKGQIFHQGENPLLSEIFQRVDSYEMRSKILDDPTPCVVLATSGMLNGGPVMDYLKHWSPNEKDTLIFVGYQAEGTTGRKIQKGMREMNLGSVTKPENIRINLDTVTCDGFSGHSDRRQLVNYITKMEPIPDRLVLCHGEESKCLDLASSMYRKYGIETVALKNLETIRFR
ncbi:MAG: beta-CASP ribonuclease aCPSF1 [Thermoplasmata archaeon HGW-Thermoplasmata-1]|nr:MAG: beta-CASP ribonuclease aCPSF1 [Thermoplasmata archaeon HGW-Thermoplasmata-1]